MGAATNRPGILGKWFSGLADIFPALRRPRLEQELSEAKARLCWQNKRMERLRQRYDALDNRYAALANEADALRSRLYAAEQQVGACQELARTLCGAVSAGEDLKRLYEAAAPRLDSGGFNLFYAAQEITGFRLSEAFLHEDACGYFEFLDGFGLLRYLKASEFGAVGWEPIPGADGRRAVLKEVDESAPEYREFERQLYTRVLERLGLRGQVL